MSFKSDRAPRQDSKGAYRYNPPLDGPLAEEGTESEKNGENGIVKKAKSNEGFRMKSASIPNDFFNGVPVNGPQIASHNSAPVKPPIRKSTSTNSISRNTPSMRRRPSMQVLTRNNDDKPINASAADYSKPSLVKKRSRSSFFRSDTNTQVRMYIEQLGKFVPNRVMHVYANRAKTQEKEVEMVVEEFNAAVLFADISGFSQLGEDLESEIGRGPGAKKLGEEVAGALIPLVNMILEQGGDVIKFAGDAIFAVFDEGSHGDLTSATIAAAVCGRKMVNFSLHNAESNVNFTVHCGVGVGHVVGMHVGGVHQRWDYCISGSALAEAISCEGDSSSGQVVISTAVKEHISVFGAEVNPIPKSANFELLSVRAEALGRHRERNTKRLIDMLQTLQAKELHTLYTFLVPYVPEPVIKSVDNGHGVWVGEVRTCVTLFIRLSGVKHGSAEDISHIHEVERLVQRKMYSYAGASFFRLIVDDKGLTNLWAFGLKWSMNQNYALNAVLAALDTHKALKQHRRSCAVGITYGRVFTGTVGGVQRCEYTLHGTQVNLAARLMGKAGDGVLCDEAVFKACRDLIDFADPVTTTVKGKVEPITVHRALNLRSSASSMITSFKLKRVASSQTAIRYRSKSGTAQHPVRTPRDLELIAHRSFSEKDNMAEEGNETPVDSAVLDIMTGRFPDTKPKKKSSFGCFCKPKKQTPEQKQMERQQSHPIRAEGKEMT